MMQEVLTVASYKEDEGDDKDDKDDKLLSAAAQVDDEGVCRRAAQEGHRGVLSRRQVVR